MAEHNFAHPAEGVGSAWQRLLSEVDLSTAPVLVQLFNKWCGEYDYGWFQMHPSCRPWARPHLADRQQRLTDSYLAVAYWSHLATRHILLSISPGRACGGCGQPTFGWCDECDDAVGGVLCRQCEDEFRGCRLCRPWWRPPACPQQQLYVPGTPCYLRRRLQDGRALV